MQCGQRKTEQGPSLSRFLFLVFWATRYYKPYNASLKEPTKSAHYSNPFRPVSDGFVPSSRTITRTICGLLLSTIALLLFVSSAFAQGQPRTFKVPFHNIGAMIVLDASVNGKRATLLLDTGADFTLISPEASGLSTVKLRTLMATQTAGANGEYVKARVDLRLAERHWVDRGILVMDLSDASKRLGTQIDGFVGQDVLREFSAVRIDYKAHVIEFEQ